MRHGKKFNHLGRKSAHRKAMLANMACSLIEHKRIKTTVAKAKALRVYVEPLITKSKTDTTHSRRVVFSYLKNKYAVKELFSEVRDRILDRPGGYTRILKIGNRLGDNAEMAIIELVDFNELAPGKAESGKKSRRRRRGGKKKTSGTRSVAPKVEEAEVVEEVAEEVVEDVVEETQEEVAEAAEEVVEEVAEEAEEVVEEVEEVVEEAAEEVVEEVEETVEEVAEAEEVVEEVVEEVAEEAPAADVEPDALKKVEGIGPKIQSILHEAGVLTFAQLAEKSADEIREILAAAGNRYKSFDPTTWPRQAQMAADGNWDELKAWQDEMKGGKE